MVASLEHSVMPPHLITRYVPSRFASLGTILLRFIVAPHVSVLHTLFLSRIPAYGRPAVCSSFLLLIDTWAVATFWLSQTRLL